VAVGAVVQDPVVAAVPVQAATVAPVGAELRVALLAAFGKQANLRLPAVDPEVVEQLVEKALAARAVEWAAAQAQVREQDSARVLEERERAQVEAVASAEVAPVEEEQDPAQAMVAPGQDLVVEVGAQGQVQAQEPEVAAARAPSRANG
jgi:hypothetical protein